MTTPSSSSSSSAAVPYGSWPSPLTSTALTAGVTGFVDLQSADGHLFLLESRPEEAGRSTLLMLDPNTPKDPGIELTPAPFNVRSRVHEYGGGAFSVVSGHVYFVNFADQNIYGVALNDSADGVQPGQPVQVTQSDSQRRYSDIALAETAGSTQLVAVCEQHTASGEPANLLVAIDPANGDEVTLHASHDFYAAPRVSPSGEELAFIAWDHPNMPWDSTTLQCGTLTRGGLDHISICAGGDNQSITQPRWQTSDRLAYMSDKPGYWNLHSVAAATAAAGPVEKCLYEEAAEYASPAWVFGVRDHIALGNTTTLAVRNQNGVCELRVIDEATANSQQLNDQYAGYHALCLLDNTVYCLADQTDGFSVLIGINLNHDGRSPSAEPVVLRQAGHFDLPNTSRPEPLALVNRSGLTTHAWFYPPAPQQDGLQPASGTELPPLLVLSHGGPSSACSPALNPRIQYYTSRGWAVADVNYGGSTGFGRAYRERLRNHWGVIDVHDCEDVATELARQKKVDSARMAIKGGSAGGYTTLAALTFGNVFAAGASHYGIGDLNALAAETHKFEARYIDALVPRDEWHERSPINHVDSLQCPVIFFQGAEDAVVPPAQAQAMVAALRAKSLPVAYVEFAGEGHGFRQAANIQRAASAEYQFFCTIFAISCPDAPVTLDIDNLPSQQPNRQSSAANEP